MLVNIRPIRIYDLRSVGLEVVSIAGLILREFRWSAGGVEVLLGGVMILLVYKIENKFLHLGVRFDFLIE